MPKRLLRRGSPARAIVRTIRSGSPEDRARAHSSSGKVRTNRINGSRRAGRHNWKNRFQLKTKGWREHTMINALNAVNTIPEQSAAAQKPASPTDGLANEQTFLT